MNRKKITPTILFVVIAVLSAAAGNLQQGPPAVTNGIADPLINSTAYSLTAAGDIAQVIPSLLRRSDHFGLLFFWETEHRLLGSRLHRSRPDRAAEAPAIRALYNPGRRLGEVSRRSGSGLSV